MKVDLRHEQRHRESTLSVRSPLEPAEMSRRAGDLATEVRALGGEPAGEPRVQLFGHYVGRVHLPFHGPVKLPAGSDTEADTWEPGPVFVAEGIAFADARAIAKMVKHELEEEQILASPPEFLPYDSTFTVGRLAWPLARERPPKALAFAFPAVTPGFALAS